MGSDRPRFGFFTNFMYSISAYGSMIADSARMDAYVKALRRSVTSNSVVMDIGAGTGIFSLLACRFGAQKVYAIEPADAIQVAREIAAANGYADRIEFIQKLSTEITLPEQADVIISDLRGLLPFLGNHIASVADARTRLLKQGGTLIGQRDDVWMAIVEAEGTYNEYLSPWEKYALDMTAAWRIVSNTTGWKIRNATPKILLAEPQRWVTLDYTKIDDPNVSGEMNFTVNREGTAHGLLLWFDATLAGGVEFSNAPGSETAANVYGRSFFPFTQPVALDEGDEVKVSLEAKLVSGDYIYRWETTVRSQKEPQRIKAHFNQSTFFGEVLSPDRLRKQSDAYIPELNPDGVIDHYILGQMTNQTPLGEIAKQLTERFPGKFARWQDALTRVGELARKYSE